MPTGTGSREPGTGNRILRFATIVARAQPTLLEFPGLFGSPTTAVVDFAQSFNRIRLDSLAQVVLNRGSVPADLLVPRPRGLEAVDGSSRHGLRLYQDHAPHRVRFTAPAMGSQGELETELEIAARNEFLTKPHVQTILELNDRVGAMLYRLHESLS